MTELLDKAMKVVEGLPPDRQDAVAGAMLDFIEHDQSLHLTDEQIAELRQRLADPDPVLLSMDEAFARLDGFWQNR